MSNELPGAMSLIEGVHRQVWPHTVDARVWADEFMAMKARLGEKAIDHAMMLGWFANAIMAGYDTAQLHS